jgi:D-alanine-D-alanine ligase
MSEYFMPVRLPATRMRGVLNVAERAAQALGTRGACRVDLLVTEGMNEYVLEVNTLPGMTPTSLLPKIAGAAGFGFAELCEALIDRALAQSAPALPAAPAAVAPSSAAGTDRPLAVAV